MLAACCLICACPRRPPPLSPATIGFVRSHCDADELINQLIVYADEGQLKQMIKDMEPITDVREFVRSHNIELPGSNF
jgi:hypothetical protein